MDCVQLTKIKGCTLCELVCCQARDKLLLGELIEQEHEGWSQGLCQKTFFL